MLHVQILYPPDFSYLLYYLKQSYMYSYLAVFIYFVFCFFLYMIFITYLLYSFNLCNTRVISLVLYKGLNCLSKYVGILVE